MKGVRVNEDITDDPIRAVDTDGTMLGVIPLQEALLKAEAAGLDLVEVSPNAEPPVCKILDYGKYRYEIQKKAKEAKKKQKIIHVKEIKLRLNIDIHDYEVKMRSARRFIEAGDKVKVSIRFRGREMAHKDLGEALLKRFVGDLADIAKVEAESAMEGRQLVAVVCPQ